MSVMIIDYGLGNLKSIYRALEECGAEVYISDNPHDLRNTEKIVLPGVGSFNDGMKKLKKNEWIQPIREEVFVNKIPILGICLGMHLLATLGYEGGTTEGLDLIQGKVVKLTPNTQNERIPHVGWNEINIKSYNILFENIPDKCDFYFVHSYHFVPEENSSIITTTPYCNTFVSSINKDNIYGVQFHPEKSIPSGFTLLKNFINL